MEWTPRGHAMPMHDWTRLDIGAYHDFLAGWVCKVSHALNHGGLLPAAYYARIEYGGRLWERGETIRVPHRLRDERDIYAFIRKTVSVRRAADHGYVAVIEIASPATTLWPRGARRFRDKQRIVRDRGIHSLVIDPFPPTDTDNPDRRPMVAVSAWAGGPWLVQPIAVGERLPDVPVYLGPGEFVTLPLEATYEAAWDGVARHVRPLLEAARWAGRPGRVG